MTWRDTIETLRSRVWLKGLDAVLTSDLPTAAGGRPRPSRYERTRRATNAARRVLPRAVDAWQQSLVRHGALPFVVDRLEPVAYGSGSTVFRLESAGRTVALKVVRETLGRRDEVLMECAREAAADQARAIDWFGEELILPTHQLLLSSPLLGQAALAEVQPFLEVETRDPVHDLPPEALRALCELYPTLREELLTIVEVTRARRAEGACADFAGYRNLAICFETVRPRVRVLDVGFFELEDLDPDLRHRQEVALDGILDLERALEERP